jgi:murein tripeptide amidase MpaA
MTDTVVVPLDKFIYYQIPGGNPEKQKYQRANA